MKTQSSDLLIHTNFLRMISNLFWCCKKTFTHMNTWTTRKKFNEASIHGKEDFYSHLNMEDIADLHYWYTFRLQESNL